MTANTEILMLDAGGLSRIIHRREVSCTEVMETFLAHIEAVNPRVNAIVGLREPDEALAEAAQRDAELAQGRDHGWLHGFPWAVKDLQEVAGLPWSQGVRFHADRIGTRDAPTVARIRAAGAVFIGKTNTPEFGLGSQSYNDVWGTTRNPYDLSLTAGGSSGGAAAAVAARMLPLADGSDTMGSIRNPPAFTNVLGLRPTQGSFPENTFPGSLSTPGPIGRTVEDLARLTTTMMGDRRGGPVEVREDLGLPAPRVGWVGDLGGHLPLEPEVREVTAHALSAMDALGWDVEPAALDVDWDALWDAWLRMRAWLGVRHSSIIANPERAAQIKPEARWEFERSVKLTAVELADAFEVRDRFNDTLSQAFDQYDFLLAPTTQVMPFCADVHWPTQIDGVEMDTYHRWMETVMPWTVSGRPVLNVPAGFDDRGRPTGLQLIGRHWEESALLSTARAYLEATRLVEDRLPPILTP